MNGRQRGFTLIAAVFLIVAIAALATCVVSLTGTQHFTTMLGIEGARAYNAARSGLEWGVYQAMNGSCAANSNLNLAGGSTAGFAVSVACTSTSHVETGTNITVYELTARAERGTYGQRGYVSRTMRVVIANEP